MNSGKFFVVVAEATSTDSFDVNNLKCFISDSTQGIQYHTGTWHAPFSCLEQNKSFVVINRHPNDRDSKDININFTKFKDIKIIIE